MDQKPPENLEAETTPERHAVELVVVVPLPDEVAYPIRREEFVILCEAELASNDQRWRDVCFGISSATFPALLGLIVETDWGSPITSKKWMVLAFIFLTMVIFLSAFAMGCYLHARIKRHKNGSAYSRLKDKIEEWFERQRQR